MKSRYLSLIAVAAIGLAVYLFWNGPHRVSRDPDRILLFSVLHAASKGAKSGGHLVLMDSSSGEIWIYSDAAFEGKEKPIHWGKLTLGQPVARLDQQGSK